MQTVRLPASSFLRLGLLLLLGVSACKTPVGIRNTGFEPVYQKLSGNVLDNGVISESTHQLIAFMGLEDKLQYEAASVASSLLEFVAEDRLRAPLVAIAELHYSIALRRGDRARFLDAAILAYLYLFGEGFQDEVNVWSPRYRLACDLYNRGLAQAGLGPEGDFSLEGGRFDTPSGAVDLRVTREHFPWGPELFSRFLPSDRFEIRGLRERVRNPGLGVPLIAIQSRDGVLPGFVRGTRPRKLAATAFLRLHGGLDELIAGTLQADIELHYPQDSSDVLVGDVVVPLQADWTAALAYGLEDSAIWNFSILGFLKGERDDFETGVFMLAPYLPGKIPVVLVHGTASNPAVWAQMINGLAADRKLAANYQIWLSLYNTGNPIGYSASLQRDALLELVATLDPNGEDPALSRMVIVGHSQGGLLTRLLVTESDGENWKNLSDIPFEEADLSPETRAILEKTEFFEPLPFVERVVFIATPHRGSYVAGGWIGRLASGLVTLPGNITNAVGEVLRGSPQLAEKLEGSSPTSVYAMDPDSNFIRYLNELPWKPGLEINSIVAVKGSGDPEGGNDGVVKYESAHLPEAESELIVRFGHSCQQEPVTILEVRRILLEHLAEGPEPANP